ncbi:MAG: nickel-dependent lactate racemase [Natronomonas sp.]|jgi:nickel-dependent lactate racemase|uniref:lactate racemase domain-containing protein n=1 Tax=Natronomonas sp. TaxID=2184060 RepID=UPI003989B93D
MAGFELLLGDGSLDVDLPDCEVTVADPPGGEAVDVREAAKRAVANPEGPELTALVDPDDTVAIVVTDITRATPDDVLVDVLLSELQRVGVYREQVNIVVGLGLHRPMTDAELDEMLGEHADLAVNHDPDNTVEVGEVDGTPIELNRRVALADRVLATGMVEPHQYAGFSGGGKTVAIGAGGEPIIRYTHGPEMLSKEGVRLGSIEDNPFRAAVDEAGDVCDLEFCLNVTHGPAGILDVAAGVPRRVVRTLAASAKEALSITIDEGYDAVVAGVGAPKDANLYQTTRAATYVILGANNPLREGGRVVIPAELSEGAGEGTGEQRFYEWLSEAHSAEALYEAMRDGYEPGAQRAFVVARALREHDVYVTNSQAPEVVEACLMTARESVADAVDPGSAVLVVPDALNTLLV